MSALSLFTKTNVPHSYVIAAYHDPASITWSWLLGWWFTTAKWLPWWQLVIWISPRHFSIRIPFVGMLSWQMQRKMPWPEVGSGGDNRT